MRASVPSQPTVWFAPPGRAESLSVTSSPPGASVEINGMSMKTTPCRIAYPGGYFHKTHPVRSARLHHSLILRISKDGYSTQQIALTAGPWEWVALTGRHHGNYLLLKSDHFARQLEPAGLTTNESWPGDARVGPIRPRNVSASLARAADAPNGRGTVSIALDPPGAELYVDGKFVGQTPAKILLTGGPHRVELRASGKKNWERDLEVMKDSERTLHPVLKPSQ